MYAVGDTHSLMFPEGDDGGEEDLCHVRSGGHSLNICSQWGMQEERRDLCHVRSGGHSLTHVPRGG